MSTTTAVVTVPTVLWVGFSGISLLRGAAFVVGPLQEYGVPRSWWTPLAVLKLLGASGLLVGLSFPVLGVAAATGLILYFLGAIVTILRARSYKTVVFPFLYLAPVVATGALAFAQRTFHTRCSRAGHSQCERHGVPGART
ncbi:DoxX family protein [Streptomyces sp. YC504]|uniref:DoxX family protein n=1 Tax=Streptomyces mesophilus TaxID=1775132 RepID=A0A6G4XD28_9ACTN|nr:DoxX family protein [Streptomyces mesophilus]NGO74624.1 DoxX family protein [Streptomyces mesophilus]